MASTHTPAGSPVPKPIPVKIRNRVKTYYFFAASLFLLVLAVTAFSDNLFYDVRQESNSDPKFIIHGLFFLAWFIILVVQANFIKQGNYKAHKRWGLGGMGIALGVILSTFYVFYALYEGWSAMPSFVQANRIFTLTFSILVVLAYIKRKKPLLHKRYLYVGTLYVLGPIIGRVADKLGATTQIQYLWYEGLIWNLLFISLLCYDWITLNRIHRITWLGFIWFYVIWIYTLLC